MKKLLILTVIALGLLIVNPSTASAAVWTEDFSNVSDWSASEGATITSDGSVGTLADASDGTGVAVRDGVARSLYDAGDTLTLVVSALNNSDTYWHLSAHQFDNVGTYLGELELLAWVNTTGTFTSTFTGRSSSLYEYVPALRISRTSGAGSASFDSLSVIPEPTSMLLLGSGLLGLLGVSRKRK